MSRFYTVIVSDPQTREVLVPNYKGKPGFSRVPAKNGVASYTSLYAGGKVSSLGSSNPNALAVEFHIPVTFMHEPLASW